MLSLIPLLPFVGFVVNKVHPSHPLAHDRAKLEAALAAQPSIAGLGLSGTTRTMAAQALLTAHGEIENEAFEGQPKLDTHRMIEGADAIAVLGEGEARFRDGGVFRFAYCTVLTFAGELIRRVDSYVVPLQ